MELSCDPHQSARSNINPGGAEFKEELIHQPAVGAAAAAAAAAASSAAAAAVVVCRGLVQSLAEMAVL